MQLNFSSRADYDASRSLINHDDATPDSASAQSIAHSGPSRSLSRKNPIDQKAEVSVLKCEAAVRFAGRSAFVAMRKEPAARSHRSESVEYRASKLIAALRENCPEKELVRAAKGFGLAVARGEQSGEWTVAARKKDLSRLERALDNDLIDDESPTFKRLEVESQIMGLLDESYMRPAADSLSDLAKQWRRARIAELRAFPDAWGECRAHRRNALGGDDYAEKFAGELGEIELVVNSEGCCVLS